MRTRSSRPRAWLSVAEQVRLTHLLSAQASEDRIWSIEQDQGSIELGNPAGIHHEDSVVEGNGLQSMGDGDELLMSHVYASWPRTYGNIGELGLDNLLNQGIRLGVNG